MTTRDKIAEMLEKGLITEEQAEKLSESVSDISGSCENNDFTEKMSGFESCFDKYANDENYLSRLKSQLAAVKREYRAKKAEEFVFSEEDEDAERASELPEGKIDELEEELEELEEKIDELEDEIEEIEHGEEDDEDEDDDEDDEDGFESLKDIGKIVNKALKTAAESVKKAELEKSINEALKQAEAEVKKTFSSENSGGTVSGKGTVIKRKPVDDGKPYENKSVYIKYVSDEFRFNGGFPVTKADREKFDKFMSKAASDEIVKLLEEQFSGFYKRVSGSEILKVTVE